MSNRVVALLSDFQQTDYYVASLKGVILGINPAVQLIDITHAIPAFDRVSAAFQLWACFRFFPKGTIFLSVVDPGVGSSRKILLAQTRAGFFFIAPDNGILTLVLNQDPPVELRYITEGRYFLPQKSSTFEARDCMAPAAAWVTKGEPCENFGPACVSPIELDVKKPQQTRLAIRGQVLYIDTFGNVITNIPSAWLDELASGNKAVLRCLVNAAAIPYRQNYAQSKRGGALFLEGSVGLVELAVYQGSAASRFELKPGDPIVIEKDA